MDAIRFNFVGSYDSFTALVIILVILLINYSDERIIRILIMLLTSSSFCSCCYLHCHNLSCLQLWVDFLFDQIPAYQLLYDDDQDYYYYYYYGSSCYYLHCVVDFAVFYQIPASTV
jgi:hypothetical protein